jgi:hypothetical protein
MRRFNGDPGGHTGKRLLARMNRLDRGKAGAKTIFCPHLVPDAPNFAAGLLAALGILIVLTRSFSLAHRVVRDSSPGYGEVLMDGCMHMSPPAPDPC